MSEANSNQNFLEVKLRELRTYCKTMMQDAAKANDTEVSRDLLTIYPEILDMENELANYREAFNMAMNNKTADGFDDLQAQLTETRRAAQSAKVTRALGEFRAILEDAEIEIEENDIIYKCPLTQNTPNKPVVSTKCHHVYDMEALKRQYTGSRGFPCPYAGCNQILTWSDIVEDAQVTAAVNKQRLRGY